MQITTQTDTSTWKVTWQGIRKTF